nr:MAG TPA: hypothetical protein [Caudoviricetes sp.]DAO71965.1 MAG TPA: hypothetical protein [Bacteriophage sp.]DAK39569.1 MAG TPA: hypothetical protein [Caudoviricetes sp.]DAS83135.1 MAG TPA: hypothetical protein [Caudoviricetes sp.]DAU78692.1 MAG TPA: hypothetical protein [Caudoviricetes sp.]
MRFLHVTNAELIFKPLMVLHRGFFIAPQLRGGV